MSDVASAQDHRKTADPLVEQSAFTLDRLPALSLVFELFSTGISDQLRQILRAPPNVSVGEATMGGLFDILRVNAGCVAGVLNCAELDSRCLALIDRDLTLSFVYVLLGGDPAEEQERADRPLTKIEVSLAQSLIEAVAKALGDAMTEVVPATFEPERGEVLIDTAILGRRDMPVVAVRFEFQAQASKGALTLVIPQSALLPIRAKLAREAQVETAIVAPDPRWSIQMQNGVSQAGIPVKGVLEEISMTLGEIANLEVGHVLNLRGSGMGRVRLECGDYDLFWCKLSQADGRYRLEIEEPIVEPADPFEGLVLS